MTRHDGITRGILGLAVATTSLIGSTFATAPHAHADTALTVQVSVSPNIMPYNYYPAVIASTIPGAMCSASVVYNNGRLPTSFSYQPITQTAGASGSLYWTWHEETVSNGGTATVRCTYQGMVATGQASFVVYH